MRWRQILEEFSPELIYIKGCKNIVADARSCLDKIDNENNNPPSGIITHQLRALI